MALLQSAVVWAEMNSLLLPLQIKAHMKRQKKSPGELTNWQGEYIHGFSASMGKAIQFEHIDAGIAELEKTADTQMYLAKHVHYPAGNLDRRGSN